MKERETNQEPEKIIVIEVDLTRGLALALVAALLLAATLAALAWAPTRQAFASSPQAPTSSAGMRQFYLTKGLGDGMTADEICAAGYHFASLWEIFDTSNLKYNTTLGKTLDDSGQGPPSLGGWVRTGSSSSDSSTPGTGNCDNWTDNDINKDGTVASLDSTWDTAGAFPGWNFSIAVSGCMEEKYVWCVED